MGFFLKIVNNIDLLGNRFYKFTVEYQSNLSYQITKKTKLPTTTTEQTIAL